MTWLFCKHCAWHLLLFLYLKSDNIMYERRQTISKWLHSAYEPDKSTFNYGRHYLIDNNMVNYFMAMTYSLFTILLCGKYEYCLKNCDETIPRKSILGLNATNLADIIYLLNNYVCFAHLNYYTGNCGPKNGPSYINSSVFWRRQVI